MDPKILTPRRFTGKIALGVGQAIVRLDRKVQTGGKSGLHRAECQVTPGGREPTESATENKPPMASQDAVGKGEMVR